MQASTADQGGCNQQRRGKTRSKKPRYQDASTRLGCASTASWAKQLADAHALLSRGSLYRRFPRLGKPPETRWTGPEPLLRLFALRLFRLRSLRKAIRSNFAKRTRATSSGVVFMFPIVGENNT